MKDVLKVLGLYFAVGFGTIFGVGAGMKATEKMFSTKSKDQKEKTEKEKVMEFIKEQEKESE